MGKQEKVIPKLGKVSNEYIDILMDEIQEAVVWSRPSILIAVHKSKNDQARAIAALELQLTKKLIKIITVFPDSDSINILNDIINRSYIEGPVFFVYGLSDHAQIYAGLNLYREYIVEHQVKVVFWLTLEEMVLLSRLAPDFWAFRHRLIEFPTGHGSRKGSLPAGILLWHRQDLLLNLDILNKKIAFEEKLLQEISPRIEMSWNYAQIVADLAYYHWLAGDNRKVTELIQQEIRKIEAIGATDIRSALLNALAINSFDQGNAHEALIWIEQALDLSPRQSFLWSNHGIICRFAGQTRRSLPSLKKAIKLNPSSFRSWGVMGYMYISLGKYAMAIKHFEEVFRLIEENANYYPALAICHVRDGNTARFDELMQKLSVFVMDNDYLAVCYDGLSGKKVGAQERLKGLVVDGKFSKTFIWRDPNLRLVFGDSVLQELI